MNWVLINMGVIWISGKINVKSAPGAMITMQSADTLSPFQMIAVKARSAERWQGSRGFQRLPLCHTRSTSSERSLHKRCQTHFLENLILSFLTFGTRVVWIYHVCMRSNFVSGFCDKGESGDKNERICSQSFIGWWSSQIICLMNWNDISCLYTLHCNNNHI